MTKSVKKSDAKHVLKLVQNVSQEFVSKWTLEELKAKLLVMGSETSLEELSSKTNGDERAEATVKMVLTAIDQGDEISVVDDSGVEDLFPETSNPADAGNNNNAVESDVTPGGTIKKKRGAKVATVVKENVVKLDRDRYGCIKGKPPALINAVLSGKAQTPEQIAEKSDQPIARVRNHLRYWKKMDKGLGKYLEETEDGKFSVKKQSEVVAEEAAASEESAPSVA